MAYEGELQLVINTFRKSRIHCAVLPPDGSPEELFEAELFRLFGVYEQYTAYMRQRLGQITHSGLYRFTDPFGRQYIFLPLPQEEGLLAVGPYTEHLLTDSELFEKAEKLQIAPGFTTSFFHYFRSLPVLEQGNQLFALIDSFAEVLWTGASYHNITELDNEFPLAPLSRQEPSDSGPAEAVWRMELMEKRYRLENDLISAVSKGQMQKVNLLLSSMKSPTFRRRLADPLREMKNYAIVMNTLLRKAAEAGGVHPIHLDSLSSEFAVSIEQIASMQEAEQLPGRMIRGYCHLVNHHATCAYSPTVQKAVTFIDYDLTADLSLQALAAALNVNASYLSARFKRETGQTVTAYVNGKRIKQAKHLLKTTNLQIQTVAQYCGVDDLQYFSKLFKKHTGSTPKAYREARTASS